ncbi:uncharacterized protein PpBr36_09363 [Pyricularia pennisetigena]|uniref:uncharacterized protein n=1 Tax=Pyricularia pennisetigena TaxID=1578925 RepID=UPI0011501825|nr:uncharacterized protein PpBr36_09363 [Pyricularia pennisetigena]TLS21769.1 hypothetical protein PpBr36_09363 [Pyricularia pennisetigena]
MKSVTNMLWLFVAITAAHPTRVNTASVAVRVASADEPSPTQTAPPGLKEGDLICRRDPCKTSCSRWARKWSLGRSCTDCHEIHDHCYYSPKQGN